MWLDGLEEETGLIVHPWYSELNFQIFSRFGKVLRIITFSKNNTFQALIQLNEAQGAHVAKSVRFFWLFWGF